MPNTTTAESGSCDFFFFYLNYTWSPAKGSPIVLGGQIAFSRQAWETFGYIPRWRLFSAGRCQGISTPVSLDSQADLVPTPQNGFQMTENQSANLPHGIPLTWVTVPLIISHLPQAFPSKPRNAVRPSLLRSPVGMLSCPLISSPSTDRTACVH